MREHSYSANIDTYGSRSHALGVLTQLAIVPCAEPSGAVFAGSISLHLTSLGVHAGRFALSSLPVGSCYIRLRLFCYETAVACVVSETSVLGLYFYLYMCYSVIGVSYIT